MEKLDTIYGIHAIKSLLRTRSECVKGLYLSRSKQPRLVELADLAAQQGIDITYCTISDLDAMLPEKVVHQSALAKCLAGKVYGEKELPELLANATNPMVLILDQVQDPHNLGACLRTANAMGASCVIAPKDRAVGLTPTVLKVACGASALTPFVQVTNLVRTLKMLQKTGLWLVGLDANAESELSNIDLSGPIGLVMGSEGPGLRQLTKKNCDYLAKLELKGFVASLNVSVATGMALYEANRQR